MINCHHYSTNQLLIKSIPSHVLSPSYYYEFIVYLNSGASSPFLTAQTGTIYNFQLSSVLAYSSPSTLYYDVVPVDVYQSVYPITLNSIYILTR